MPSKTPDQLLSLPASQFDQPGVGYHADNTWSTTQLRILVLSDTHRTPPFPSDSNVPYRDPLPDADLLIHAGDVTEAGLYEEHLTTYELISKHPATVKLVIPGNHDLSLDYDYFVTREQTPAAPPGIPTPQSKQAREELYQQSKALWTGEDAIKNGIVMCIEEGIQEVQVKGTTLKIYTTGFTPRFWNWAFAYSVDGKGQDRFNEPGPSAIPPGVDIIVSHGPPYGILDEVIPPGSGIHVGDQSLLAATRRVKPLLHVFGHIHEGYGVQIVQWSNSTSAGHDGCPVWRGGNSDLVKQGDPSRGRRKVNWIRATKSDEEQKSAVSEGLELIIDYGKLERGEQTMFVNAAIMTSRNRPANSPWVIDIDVPARQMAGGNSIRAVM